MKKILISLSIILGAAAVAIGGTGANLPQTDCQGGLNLRIDIDGIIYEHLTKPIFELLDMKPGDQGEETLSLHVNQTSCGFVKFNLTSDRENGCTEPEKLVDTTCGNPGEGKGELNDKTKWIIWQDVGGKPDWQCGSQPKCSADPLEGDNILNGKESVWVQGVLTADKKYNIGELFGNKVPYYGFAWCFGEWGPGFSCQGAGMGNETQGDSFKADMIFSVEQKQNHYDKGCPSDNKDDHENDNNNDNDHNNGNNNNNGNFSWPGGWNFNKLISFFRK